MSLLRRLPAVLGAAVLGAAVLDAAGAVDAAVVDAEVLVVIAAWERRTSAVVASVVAC